MNDSQTSEWNEFTRTWCLINRFHSQRIWNLFIHSRWLVHNPKTSYGETEYLARCPEEWNTTVEQEDVWVNRLRSSPDTLGITCYASNISINFQRTFNFGWKSGFRDDFKNKKRFRIHFGAKPLFALRGLFAFAAAFVAAVAPGFTDSYKNSIAAVTHQGAFAAMF